MVLTERELSPKKSPALIDLYNSVRARTNADCLSTRG